MRVLKFKSRSWHDVGSSGFIFVIIVSSKTCTCFMFTRDHICFIEQRTDLTTKGCDRRWLLISMMLEQNPKCHYIYIKLLAGFNIFDKGKVIRLALLVRSVLKYRKTRNSSGMALLKYMLLMIMDICLFDQLPSSPDYCRLLGLQRPPWPNRSVNSSDSKMRASLQSDGDWCWGHALYPEHRSSLRAGR